MDKTSICICYGNEFKPNPRVKNQMYCKRKKCQKARRVRWQREKMRNDADYRDNQKRCHIEWLERHPGYYSRYRARHPEKVERNRLLQFKRDMKKREDKIGKYLAKMDSLWGGFYSRRGGLFRIVPQGKNFLANMDSLLVKVIPEQYVRRV